MILLEREIQKTIIEYLTYLENLGKLYFFRAGSGAIKLDNGRYFKTGKPGLPDIIVLIKGMFIGLEVKTSNGKQSKIQKEAEENIKKNNGYYFIVRSIEDVENILKLK